MARFRHLHASAGEPRPSHPDPNNGKHFAETPDLPSRDWRSELSFRDAETRNDLTPEEKAEAVHMWNPPHGETHIHYLVSPGYAPSRFSQMTESGGWLANHYGPYQGRTTIKDSKGYTKEVNDYNWDDHDNIGHFPTVEDARAATEQYHQNRYGDGSKPSADHYDIDRIMREQGF